MFHAARCKAVLPYSSRWFTTANLAILGFSLLHTRVSLNNTREKFGVKLVLLEGSMSMNTIYSEYAQHSALKQPKKAVGIEPCFLWLDVIERYLHYFSTWT
jgi:hypothetical protein